MTKHKSVLMALGGLMMLGFAGGARADLHMTYKQQAAISPTGVSLRDIAVNKNVGSPYYGYVYAANVTGTKVNILRPARPEDGSGAASLVDTGLTITASGSSNLFGVAIGDDDSVWIGVYGSGNIETAPPVPAEGETSVTAVKQFAITGGIRGIAMKGTLEDAKVFIQTNDVKLKTWSGGTTAWDTAGTFTEHKVFDLKTIHATNVQIGYGLGADKDGNAYVGLTYNAVGAAAPLVAKIKWDGTLDSDWGGKRPPFTNIANSLADADVVEDSRLPGGGYVYYGARQVTGGVNKRIIHRYRLDNGAWLDSFGPAAATGFAPPTDASYTVLDGIDNAASPYYFGADDKGNLYLNSGNQATLTKIVASQPYLVASGEKNSAGDVIKSSPTVVDGIAYVGASDGKLYAYTVADGNPVAGFPVDVAGLLEQPNEKLLGRPSVYYADVDGSGPAKYIYFTTSGGFVCRLDANGENLKYGLVPLNSGGVNATPAVLSDGTVYVGLYDGTAARVYKFTPDFSDSMQSSSLGYGNMSSVAVAGNNVFVGLSAAASKRMAVLNAATLDVLNTFDGQPVSAPPYVSEGFMYFGTQAGNFYKVNASTGALDETFGDEGEIAIGEPISTSAFRPHGIPALFVGTDTGKVFAITDSGTALQGFETGDVNDRIGGIVTSPTAVAFGTSSGAFYVLAGHVSESQVYRGHGLFSGMPAYDAATKQFLLGSDDGNLYAFPDRVSLLMPD